MVRQKLPFHMVISIVFSVTFLLMFFFLYLFSGGIIQSETYAYSFLYAVICSLLSTALLKRRLVKKTLKELKIAILWAMLLSAILIHSMLNRQGLSIIDFVFLALVGFWAGVILVDLDSIVVGCVIAFGLCVFIMFFALSLPAFLGVLSYPGLNDIVYNQAVRMIFLAVFPFPLFLGVVSSILGGYVGEKIFASV